MIILWHHGLEETQNSGGGGCRLKLASPGFNSPPLLASSVFNVTYSSCPEQLERSCGIPFQSRRHPPRSRHWESCGSLSPALRRTTCFFLYTKHSRRFWNRRFVPQQGTVPKQRARGGSAP